MLHPNTPTLFYNTLQLSLGFLCEIIILVNKCAAGFGRPVGKMVCLCMSPSLPFGLLAGLQMGQGLWRVARNQHLQQEAYSEPGYLSREQSRRGTSSTISQSGHRKQAQGGIDIYHLLKARKSKEQEGFINLEMLPPELSFTILSYLNATDLCLASCVWQDLANDELLWQG